MTTITHADRDTIRRGNPMDGSDDRAEVAAYYAAIERVGPEAVRAIRADGRVDREEVGAGDWSIGLGLFYGRKPGTVEVRWGVYQFSGFGHSLQGSLGTRAEAVRYARKEWAAALRENRVR